MRIAICSKRDLTSTILLNDLLPRLAKPEHALKTILAERTRPIETSQPELIRMKFLERDLPFGRLRLDRLVSPHPVNSAERLLGLQALEIAHGVEIRTAHSWAEAADELLAFMPDLILSVRFSFAFREPALSVCRHGIINVHPGEIPRYAGLYPHFYSMLAGEPVLGCTVHYVDESIDSGPVLATGEIPINRSRSAFRHNLDSHLLGNRMLAQIVDAIRTGTPPVATPQMQPAARPNTYPASEEFARFHADGLSLIHRGEYMGILRRFGADDGLHLSNNWFGTSVAAQMIREG